jgi:hypothetical protein
LSTDETSTTVIRLWWIGRTTPIQTKILCARTLLSFRDDVKVNILDRGEWMVKNEID